MVQATRYTHIIPPNGLSCVYNVNNAPTTLGGIPTLSAAINNGATATTPSSRHPGGVNAAFSDGSIRFIKNSIDAATWWALGSKDGGEVISSDSY